MIRNFLFLFVILGLMSCNNEVKQDSGKTPEKNEIIEEEAVAPETPKEEVVNNEQSDNGKETMILISTSMGDIKAILYNETPKHRDNFIKLINEGWYNNSPFHRVINQFMIQGGHNQDGRVDPGYTIPAEFNPALLHKKGVLSAARMGDQVNPERASSGCQFYLVQGKKSSDAELNMMEKRLNITYSQEQRDDYKTKGGTPFLDMQYTVFGEVIEGLDIIDKIAAIKTGEMDKPLNDVTMNISIIK